MHFHFYNIIDKRLKSTYNILYINITVQRNLSTYKYTDESCSSLSYFIVLLNTGLKQDTINYPILSVLSFATIRPKVFGEIKKTM